MVSCFGKKCTRFPELNTAYWSIFEAASYMYICEPVLGLLLHDMPPGNREAVTLPLFALLENGIDVSQALLSSFMRVSGGENSNTTWASVYAID